MNAPTLNAERVRVRSLAFKVSREQLLAELEQLGWTGPKSYTKAELAIIIGCLRAGGKLTGF